MYTYFCPRVGGGSSISSIVSKWRLQVFFPGYATQYLNMRFCVFVVSDVCACECVTQVMSGGPDAMAGLQNDPETMELLKKLNEAMASVRQ